MNTNYKIRNSGRRNIAIVLCVFLLTVPIATFTGTSFIKTSNQKSVITSTVEIPKSQIPDDPAESLSYSFLFTEPTFEKTKLFNTDYTKITMPGTMTTGKKAGAPAMPFKIVQFLLPAGKQVKSIDVAGNSEEIKFMDLNLQQTPVVPYQKPVPIGFETPKEIDFDTVLYASHDRFPEKMYDGYTVGYCRGYAILSVTLNPVQYIPNEGRLFYYSEMTIDIQLEETDEINRFYRNKNSDEAWVKNLVPNPEMTTGYQRFGGFPLDYPGGLCDPSDDYDYVIITTTQGGLDHWETSGSIPYNWTSLMDKHETDDGLSCTLVTTEDINACLDYYGSDSPVDDLQAHIREFCRDAYQDWGTDYIFIGGDDEWIPARHMRYDYEGNVDSDIYWSNLDKNFNADHDSYWGEEGDAGFDLYAELFIGRITCDIPQDVSNWMTKSFYYTDSVYRDYLENAAFYGGALGWNCGGDDFIDYGAIKGTDNWLGPIPGAHGPYPSWLGFQYGFETWNNNNPGMEYDLSVKWTAEYPPNPGWQGGSESAAVTGLRTAINNDQCTLISAVAHAHEGMSMDVGMSTWESQYHNTMPFFLHDFGCHCGDMDAADDGVLHSMLFHSDTELAFACIYNTCYGWGSFDDTNSSSALQMKSFWDYFFDMANNSQGFHNWQLGKAMAWSKDTMAPTINWTYSQAPGSWRGVIQGCLLFGDPAQRIKPPIQPEHNVGVASLDVSSHVAPDEPVYVNATIVNNGNNDEENVFVSFRVNGTDMDTYTIPSIASQTTEEVSFTWTPSLGWYTVTINVTIPGVVEDYYFDNEKSQLVIAGPDIAVTNLDAPSYAALGMSTDISGTIANLGATDESIDVYLKINGTVEDSQSIYLNSGTNTIVTFLWEPSFVGTYPVAICAEISDPEPYRGNNERSQDVQVFEAGGYVLLVDDDDGDSYESYFENALFASGYLYDVWDRYSQGSPPAGTMANYNAVVWFTGDDYWSTLDSTDQANLASYLDNGGSLFITGQDIGYDIGGTSFYLNYLHANYLTDDVNIYTLEGVPGDPIGDGLTIGISTGDGANNQYWPSGISPRTQATTVFEYQSSTYDGGIKADTGTYRVVYFSFGYEAINNFNDRVLVMGRTLGWLIGNYTTPDIWIDPTLFDCDVLQNEIVSETLTIGNEVDATDELSFDLETPHGWLLQWEHTYGGNGHSQLAQPVGDIDEDGMNEVIVGGYASYTAFILSYNPVTGNYDQEYEWSEGGATPSGACVIDLDDDGDLELAMSWEYGYADGVYAYDWDGSTLTTLASYSGTGYDFCFDVYACDYDDDEDVEVLIANWPGYSGGYHVTALRWDNINDQFVRELSWGSGSSEECPMVWSGDTDNDGDTEVIAAVGPSTVYALNYMGGTWSPTIVASGLPAYPYGIAVGNLDDDGIDEIGIATEYTQAYIYDWNGASYQQVWYHNYAGEQDIIEAVAIGDADNDGQNEYLVGTNDIHVLSYTGSDYVEESTILYTDGQLAGTIIADCDTDGLNEVKANDILSSPGNEWIIEYEPEPTWLSMYPDIGSIAIGDSMDITVTINATGLAPGEYATTIIINSNDLDENPLEVPVNIEVISGVVIEGYCFYENMTPADNITVDVINLNTEKRWQADTINNYYTLTLVPGEDINISETIRVYAKDHEHYKGLVDHTFTEINPVTTLNITIEFAPGDVDFDGDVDLSDLSQLLAHYGMTSDATYEDGDIDGDGDVDISDLAELLAHYGEGT